MKRTVGIISADRTLDELARSCGSKTTPLSVDQLTAAARGPAAPLPDAVIVDVREDRRRLADVGAIKRRHAALPIAIVVSSLTQEVMIEAMRAGVTEAIAEPLSADAIEEALKRIIVGHENHAQGEVIAVVGAKGGIGATTIAVNLAEAFAKSSGDCLLIDLEQGAGDAAVFIGVEPRFTVAEALENTHRLDETFLRSLVVRTKSGFDLLAASARVIDPPPDSSRLRMLIEFASRHYQYVVLDVPRGDIASLDSLASAAHIFVVVNHELPTIRSAQRLVTRLKASYGERVGLMINRSDRLAEISLDDIKQHVKAPIGHVFPSDYRQALAAMNKGEPLARTQASPLAASFHDCVRKMRGEPQASPAEESSRLFGWLSSRRSA